VPTEELQLVLSRLEKRRNLLLAELDSSGAFEGLNFGRGEGVRLRRQVAHFLLIRILFEPTVQEIYETQKLAAKDARAQRRAKSVWRNARPSLASVLPRELTRRIDKQLGDATQAPEPELQTLPREFQQSLV
jgi:hypothetical protein